MLYACEICGKEGGIGSTQRHRRGVAGKRWKNRAQATPRTFRPNLQRVTLKFAENVKKMRICTKCLKRIKKFGSIKEYSNVAVA